MKRTIALLVVLAVGAGITLGMGELARPRAYTQEGGALEAAFDAERALATDQGLVVAIEETSGEPTFSREVPLGAGECLALVASIEGTVSLSASLHVGTLEPAQQGDLVHLAACATEAGTATASLSWASMPSFDHPQQIHYALLRGRPRSPRTYARLTYDARTRASFDADAVHARVAVRVPEAARIGSVRTADSRHAVLVPATRASFAALRALVGRRGVVPEVVPELPSVDPFATADDVAIPPRVLMPSGRARLVAVVDAGALGASCIEVVLARPDDPITPTSVRRLSIPDQHVDSVVAIDPAISVDHLCPASGLFLYVVDESAGGDYEVSVARVDAEVAEAPTPSTFGAPSEGRHASDELPVLPLAFVASTRASCASGDADACLALAVLAHDAIEGAGTVREALDPLCTASGGTACDVLAGAIESVDPARSHALERRACTTGVPSACLRHGARFLADASDLPRAYQTFRYGCAHGSTECCTSASTMQEWQLAPADASATTPDEPG